KLAVDSADAGRKATCPNCQTPFVVPGETIGSDLGLLGEDAHVHTDALRAKWAETSSAVSRLKRDLGDAQAEIARLREQLAAVTAERDSFASASAMMQETNERATAARMTIEEQLSLNRQRLSATEAQLSAREQELAQAHTAVNAATIDADDLKRANDELIAE